MTTTRKVAVAVIGAGTAGLVAFREARKHHEDVVLIEGGVGGTTCAREGCMPSKLLIAAAEAAQHAREAAGFGVEAGPVRIDGKAVMARVRRERDRFVGFVREGVEKIPAALRVEGYARFEAPGVLRVGETRIEADAVVVATGSTPIMLPFFEGLGDRLITNAEVFDWEDLPGSVAVLGPGVIGLELGQALHRLGVRVRLLGASGRVGPLNDPALQAEAREIFGGELDLSPAVKVTDTRRVDGGVEVVYERDGETRREVFDYLLTAIGRRPNLARLGLENAGIELDEKGRPVGYDRTTGRVGDSPVFLAGDANDDVPLLHEAADEGRIAGGNAARYPDVIPGRRKSPVAVVFSDPQMMSVGAALPDLDPAALAVGEVSFRDQGRSRVMRVNRGRLRIYFDRASGRFEGAAMVGPRAEHLAHLLAWAHQAGLDLDEMLAMPFYHPVIEEGLRTALRDADRKRRELAAAAAGVGAGGGPG